MIKIGNKFVYQYGERVGSCVFLRETEPNYTPSGIKIRKALFRCKCGKEFLTSVPLVRSGNTKSCGCLYNETRKTCNSSHGLWYEREYRIWDAMIQRCYNSNHKQFHRYGGRNIKVCDEWKHNPKEYIEYVRSLPKVDKDKKEIDRINNDKGYYPGNLQWATRREQQMNRSSTGNTSGFVGVSYCKSRDKWESEITIRGERVKFGRFSTIIEAANARNNYIIKHGLWEYPIQNTLAA